MAIVAFFPMGGGPFFPPIGGGPFFALLDDLGITVAGLSIPVDP